jgi:hypothetical protein
MLILLTACSNNDVSIKKSIQRKKIYTQEEYMVEFRNEIYNHHEIFYMGLTSDDLLLLNKPFKSATIEEVNNDIAYNRKTIKLKHEYTKTVDFLKNDKNLNKLSNHLNYSIEETEIIVFKGNNVIITYISDKNNSFESYLVSIKQYSLRIKLIGYLYGS